MGTLRFGTSGWSYEEWLGVFYETASESKLAAYTKVFNTAEIDSSFYRAPTKGMVLGWLRYTPEDFVFAAKVPQTVTHDRRIDVAKRAEEDVRAFCELMDPLNDAGKLGPLLLQLPPSLRFDPGVVRRFFETLPHRYKWAIEFRNKSWLVPEAYDLLREFHVAYTIVDEPLLPPDVHLTADFSYIRWHGRGKDPWYDYQYSPEELRDWVPKVEKIAEASDPVYGFFNNHYHGYAPENGLQILEMLGAITPAQSEMKRHIEDFRAGITRVAGGKFRAVTLDSFADGAAGVPPVDTEVSDALKAFADAGRLERAARIPNADVQLEDEKDEVRARVKDYQVVIDFTKKTILHDCDDWSSRLVARKFCKHVAKVFLQMNREAALDRLDVLRGQRKEWRFEVPSEV
ncbi:MAG: DUF72 domain-containing protein [Methanobacteriota archaeon]|nr:MAG: DUF72 domain-containing protein [Euryarchaeota archaeon]